MNERWLPVVGYEGLYEVSDLGRVRSLDRTTPDNRRVEGRVLKARIMRDGYMRVCLCRENIKRGRAVHILVCEAFYGARPTPSHVAAHGDGTRVNNLARNLRWATRQENESDKLLHGTALLGEKANCAKLTETQVLAIRAASGSHAALAAHYGVTPFAIYAIRKRRNWRHLPEISDAASGRCAFRVRIKRQPDEAAIPTG